MKQPQMRRMQYDPTRSGLKRGMAWGDLLQEELLSVGRSAAFGNYLGLAPFLLCLPRIDKPISVRFMLLYGLRPAPAMPGQEMGREGSRTIVL